MVDAVGGIDVDVTVPVGGFGRGMNHMDGAQALAYLRDPSAAARGDRARRQQSALRAILTKAASSGTLADPVQTSYDLLTAVDVIDNGVVMATPGWTLSIVPGDNGEILRATQDVVGATLYWDTDGATPGSGGATPSGNWDGASANFSPDATGSSATTSATSGSANVVFSAGSDATGSYTVNISGARAAALNLRTLRRRETARWRERPRPAPASRSPRSPRSSRRRRWSRRCRACRPRPGRPAGGPPRPSGTSGTR